MSHDLRELCQPGEGVLIPAPNEALSPGREKNAEPVIGGAVRDPVDEPFESQAVNGQLIPGFMALGKGTVRARVVATRQRTAIED